MIKVNQSETIVTEWISHNYHMKRTFGDIFKQIIKV